MADDKPQGPGKGNGEGSRSTRFGAGQSGNPGGRKRDKELTALAREFTEEALKTLADVMRDAGQMARDRVKAAEVLLDRGWGKARESVEITGANGGPVQMVDYSALSEEELLLAMEIQRKAVLAETTDEVVH